MTLKPPTRSLPKVVVKEWPERTLLELGEQEASAGFPSLDEFFRSAEVPLRGGCGEIHHTAKERLECAACNHAIATNSRPWMYDDKALSDFTRVVEETGILDQQRPQKADIQQKR